MPFQPAQIGEQFLRKLIALAQVALQTSVDDAIQLQRTFGVDAARLRRRCVEYRIEHPGDGGAPERLLSRGHFVQHGPKGEEVRCDDLTPHRWPVPGTCRL